VLTTTAAFVITKIQAKSFSSSSPFSAHKSHALFLENKPIWDSKHHITSPSRQTCNFVLNKEAFRKINAAPPEFSFLVILLISNKQVQTLVRRGGEVKIHKR